MPEKANGRFVRLLPELSFREAQRVKESDRRVEFLREGLQIGLLWQILRIPTACESAISVARDALPASLANRNNAI